ncbi:RNA-directed DNA polymerase, eukaryota, reverse transcriptase zinc-binding domain protein [Tanacetum coccineum]
MSCSLTVRLNPSFASIFCDPVSTKAVYGGEYESRSLGRLGRRSGSLVGQGSTCNRVCGREYPSAVRVCPRRFNGCGFKSITSLKCVLTQEHLDAICAKYFVPEEVHPQLPSSDATMHERPAGKVGMYTRFFDYANYRIPFSTFFVSVLTHFRIPISQLSVFGSAKKLHTGHLIRVLKMTVNQMKSSESYCSYGKKSDTIINPTLISECYTEQLMPTNKEADQPITTEFNKDQGNECQDGSCNEQSIYNRKVINENTHTNITEIKEAMANNTINDGVEESKSSWPPGYTDNASYFNEFIANGNLVDIPMGGYKFTRVDKSCTKGSRLDRFLNADLTWNHLGPLTVLALDRTISDHPPNSPTPIHSTEFFKMADIPNRMQSSFITLIPKIESPLVVNDFRPISLIGILYKIIAKIISCRIALIIADIVDPVQSSFIKNRQILDGLMILNEVVHTLKRKKKKAMIFKVDIMKAYDTLNEMFFTLHMEDAIEAKKYIGINIVIFGLFANSVMKTKLLRGWVATETELNHLPDKFSKRLSKWRANCLLIGGRSILISGVLGWLPTYYLSLFRMPRTVCNKLEAMRSKFFWGAEDTNRKIHWVKWDLVFASKDRRGLGFGSLHSLNLAHLYKWRWRFNNHHNALWAKIIKNLYPFSSETQGWVQVRKQGGPWNNIMQTVSELHNTSMVPISVMKRKIGDGMSTLFWHDVWINDTPLAQQFPRLFLLEEFKNAMVGDRWNGSCFAWRLKRRPYYDLITLFHSC